MILEARTKEKMYVKKKKYIYVYEHQIQFGKSSALYGKKTNISRVTRIYFINV